MSDFKSEFFNLESLRNTILARVGEYMMLPAQIDAMTATAAKMTSAASKDYRIVLPSLKDRVNKQLTAALALKDELFAFSDKVQKNPELAKVIAGQVSLLSFSMKTVAGLFNKSTDVNAYKDYLATALALSKKGTKMVTDMEGLKAEVANVQTAITNNLKLNPIIKEPSTWQSKGALYLGLGIVALGAGTAYLRHKKGK